MKRRIPAALLILAASAGSVALLARPLHAQVSDMPEGEIVPPGVGRAYACPGARGGVGTARMLDMPALRRALVSLAGAGTTETRVARRLGCMAMHSRTSSLFIRKPLSHPIHARGAIWLVAEVTLSEPGATGYDFDAVLRLPEPHHMMP